MTTFTISESGMTFGPFERDDCFEVEACAAYKRIKPHGVKIAEFVWLPPARKSPQMWIVEAKTGAPKTGSGGPPPDFVGEVREKFVNALTMVMCACLSRPGSASAELPGSFGAMDLAAVKPRFILVVRDHKDDWLAPLADVIREALRPTIKTWGIDQPSIIVMNEASARKKNLIQ